MVRCLLCKLLRKLHDLLSLIYSDLMITMNDPESSSQQFIIRLLVNEFAEMPERDCIILSFFFDCGTKCTLPFIKSDHGKHSIGYLFLFFYKLVLCVVQFFNAIPSLFDKRLRCLMYRRHDCFTLVEISDGKFELG